MMRFRIFMLKLLGVVKHGPFMMQIRDYWLFIDVYQRIWKITYTGRHDYPFTITLIQQ